jgi:hypothetical protein
MRTTSKHKAPGSKAEIPDAAGGMPVIFDQSAKRGVISRSLASVAILFFMSTAGADEPALSQRTPLLDVAMRTEVDSYSRLDRVQNRSDQLPDVYDPGIYLEDQQPSAVRGQLNRYLLWLESQRADHFFAVESLPDRMSAVATREPYKAPLIENYRDSAPERLSLLQEFYEAERDLITLHLAFVDFVETKADSADAFGFAFKTEEDMSSYSNAVVKANQAFSRRQLAVGRYQAWERDQKETLQSFRDQL